MAARANRIAVAAAQHVGHVRGAEALPDPGDTRQDLARDGNRLRHLLQLAKAVIARAAIVLGERFAEVADQPLVPAADARGITLHVAQQRSTRVAQLTV